LGLILQIWYAIEDAVTAFDDPVIDPVHIASTVPTMDLNHTESKLDMRTLLVMNPQDLAEQGIGVEKFFENMKEVANSMIDRQRQSTVSDALCSNFFFSCCIFLSSSFLALTAGSTKLAGNERIILFQINFCFV
jgi:hypothetical protein